MGKMRLNMTSTSVTSFSSRGRSRTLTCTPSLSLILMIMTFVSLGPLPAASVDPGHYRICVPERFFPDCSQMVQDLTPEGGRITCVSANDKIGCISKVTKNEADFLPLDPEEIFISDSFSPGSLRVIGEIRSQEFSTRDFKYEPVAIVRNSARITSISSLRGKRSCHTGFGRNAGWKVPFSHLMEKGELSNLCGDLKGSTPERDLFVVSKYFERGCVPGPWVPDKDKDHVLREKYPNLCSLCENPHDCSGKDKYASYEGALRCLTQNDGDVAWTKMDAVVKFFKLNEEKPEGISSLYSFLCWNGSSVPLTSKAPCSWARRPWNAYTASKRLLTSEESIKDLQDQVILHKNKGLSTGGTFAPWLKTVLELNGTTEVEVMSPPAAVMEGSGTPAAYLGAKNFSVTIRRPSCGTGSKEALRLCVRNELEMSKCRDLRLGALGRRILPQIHCVLGSDEKDCIGKVANDLADTVLLEPKTAEWARKKYGLEPILSELEEVGVGPGGTKDLAPHRLILALVRGGSSIKSLSDLRGLKSCHGSINSIAGWNGPLVVLEKAKLLAGPRCALPNELTLFFNGTCVPGSSELKVARMPWLNESALCELCAGDASPGPSRTLKDPTTNCKDGKEERYFGAGALHCLTDNVADVVFLDHVQLLRGGHGIDTKDFKLLCAPNGGLMEVTDYRHCNWGKIPSSVLIGRSGVTDKVKSEDIHYTFLKLGDVFSPQKPTSVVFSLFGPYYSNPDLIVHDTAMGLGDEAGGGVERLDWSLIRDIDYCEDGGEKSGGWALRSSPKVILGVGVSLVLTSMLSRIF